MTAPISFTVTDIPPESTGETIVSDDPVCVDCGAPLSYSGRGRKPKRCDACKPGRASGGTSAPRRSANKDVDAAMAALAAAHTSMGFVLMVVAGDSAQVWEAQLDSLNERNRAILESDPKLAKKLATVAAKGGGPALVISHFIAVAPVAGLAYANLRVARAMKDTVQREAAADNVRPMHTAPDPDAAFR